MLARRLRGDPEACTRFWIVRTGMIRRESFFNAANLQRLLAGSAAAVAGSA